MTKLGWVVIKSFLGPFLLNFIVWMLLLDMQSLWLYVDDLMGKGLEWPIVLELMFYFSANWVPVALPLSILLASIMTFGKLGEHNELTAMKAAGISLFRIMRPLLLVTVLIAAFAFYFSNSLWPMANFKLRVLISDIQETKASIIFKEGIFYDELEGYNIRIEEKAADGKTFKDILIYDYTGLKNNIAFTDSYRDYKRVISAKEGVITQSKGSKHLILELTDGLIMQEMDPKNVEKSKMPYSRYYFEKAILPIELESFDFERSEDEKYAKEEYLMTLTQIKARQDSLIKDLAKYNASQFSMIKGSYFLSKKEANEKFVDLDTIVPTQDYFASMDKVDQKMDIIDAIAKLQTKISTLKGPISQHEVFERYGNDLDIKWHEKFTLSFAVMMLFFLGASLGAIVKKGGLGVPVLIAIALFLVYFILTRGGQEMASSGTLSPFWGMWLSALILTPIAIFIFIKARNDSKIFDIDFYNKMFGRLLKRKQP